MALSLLKCRTNFSAHKKYFSRDAALTTASVLYIKHNHRLKGARRKGLDLGAGSKPPRIQSRPDLHVWLNNLVSGENERGPAEDLALQFETARQFTNDEKQTVHELLKGMTLKHETRRWDASRGGSSRCQRAGGRCQAAGARGRTTGEFL